MKYSTLLFDNDNTLMDFAAAEAEALERTFRDNSIPFCDRLLASYSAINTDFWKRCERGEIEREDIFEGRFRAFAEKNSLTFDCAKVSRDYGKNLAYGHKLINGAMELLQNLSRNYAIYIVTNGISQTQDKRIKDAGMLPYLRGVFVSETTGFQKPQPGYFQYVFAHIEEKDPSKLLIIGDSLSSDIKGGANAGIDTCWYNPSGDPCGDLRPTYEIRSLEEIYSIL